MPARRALAALALVALASGGCALAGRTLGGYVDDKIVKVNVKRRLAGEEVGHRQGVTVDTFGGTVYLSGAVETEAQKTQAEYAAWQVDGVQQVVNDLVVRGADAPSASPPAEGAHPLTARLPGVVRVESSRPGGPDLAYDRQGRIIATVYRVSSQDLLERNLEALRADGRSIDHVEIFPLLDRPDVPVLHYAVVLWHVSEPEAAARR